MISTPTNRQVFSGDGVTSIFAVTDYKAFLITDVVCTVVNTTAGVLAGIPANSEIELTYGSHFTVALGTPETGETAAYPTITLLSPYANLPSGVNLVSERKLPITQEIRLTNNEGTPAAVYVEAFDRAVCLIQQLQALLNRGVLQGVTATSPLAFPALASGYLRSDGSTIFFGDATVTVTDYEGTISGGLYAARPGSPVPLDIYIATDTKQILLCFTAGTWTPSSDFYVAVNTPQGADMASATSMDIGAATGNYLNITGVTAITGLGTARAGTLRICTFKGILTFTHGANIILPGGASITTAAEDVVGLVSLGAGVWKAIFYTKASGRAVVEPAVVVPAFENALLHVRDEKAANTEGGTFTGGLVFRTRTLNTVKTNQITGASLSSNQITLPAGTYDIIASAPHVNVNQNRLRLRNITDSTNDVFGPNDYSATGGGMARLEGRFTIAGEKVFELQHTCNNTQNGDGFGIATNSDSMLEVYAEVRIWKVA